MKPRKELKPGDRVKWVGYDNYGSPPSFEEWNEILHNTTPLNGDVLVIRRSGAERKIAHRQVTHVRRVVKNKRREFWLRRCEKHAPHDRSYEITLDHGLEPNGCDYCEVIRVREVREKK